MSLKLEGSQNTQIDHVLPFEIPATQTTIEDAYYEFFDPTNLDTNYSSAQQNIRWECSGSSDSTDLKSSYILLRCKVRNNAGNPYANVPNGAVVANDQKCLATGWSQLLVDRLNFYLNGVNTSDGDQYCYKGWVASLMDNERGYASEPINAINTLDPAAITSASYMKTGDGEQEGWVLDTAGRTEAGHFAGNPDRRYTFGKYLADETEFTIMLKPKESLFMVDKFLIPQIKIKLEMLTSVPNFFINASNAVNPPQISFLNARLYLKRIKLTPSGQLELFRNLERQPTKYLFPRMRYTNHFMGQVVNMNVVSLLPGPKPNRVFVFFSKYDSSSPTVGQIYGNPVAFSEFHNAANFVKRIYINVGGRQYPRQALEMLSKNDTHRAYEMYKLSCSEHTMPMLSLEQFTYNYTIYCFNTTKTLNNDDEGVLHSGPMSDIQVQVEFNIAPTVDVVMHVISVDDGLIEIDGSGTVTKSY